jgi:plastocyanin
MTSRAGGVAAALVVLIFAALSVACGDDGSASAKSNSSTGATAGQTATFRPSPVAASIKMIASRVFDKTELDLPANQDVLLTIQNTDDGAPHSFSVYRTGPCKQTLALHLAAGTYYFRCEVHPQTMNGTVLAN